jgi:hypothetical protein
LEKKEIKCSICGVVTNLNEKDLDTCNKVCSEECNEEVMLRIKMGSNPALYSIAVKEHDA